MIHKELLEFYDVFRPMFSSMTESFPKNLIKFGCQLRIHVFAAHRLVLSYPLFSFKPYSGVNLGTPCCRNSCSGVGVMETGKGGYGKIFVLASDHELLVLVLKRTINDKRIPRKWLKTRAFWLTSVWFLRRTRCRLGSCGFLSCLSVLDIANKLV